MNRSASVNNTKTIDDFIRYLCRTLFHDKIYVQVILNETKSTNSVFNPKLCRVINDRKVYSIIVSTISFKNNTEDTCKSIITSIIDAYAFERGIKDASRGYTYHNAKFNELCAELGLKCTFDSSDSGYKILGIPNRILDAAKNVKLEQVYTPNKHSGSNSTVKYVDKFGNSVRATKEHILICLDNYPALAVEIEKKYGIKRMHIEK